MATTRKSPKRVAAGKKAARTRRRNSKTTPAKRTRRKTSRKKKGLGDLFSRNEAEAGFKQALGVGAGFVAGEYMSGWINPDGSKNQWEIIAKLGGGFMVSTTGRMPNFGAGIMASGFKKLLEVQQQGSMRDQRTDYLQDAKLEKTGMTLNDSQMEFLHDYTSKYTSKRY